MNCGAGLTQCAGPAGHTHGQQRKCWWRCETCGLEHGILVFRYVQEQNALVKYRCVHKQRRKLPTLLFSGGFPFGEAGASCRRKRFVPLCGIASVDSGRGVYQVGIERVFRQVSGNSGFLFRQEFFSLSFAANLSLFA